MSQMSSSVFLAFWMIELFIVIIVKKKVNCKQKKNLYNKTSVI